MSCKTFDRQCKSISIILLIIHDRISINNIQHANRGVFFIYLGFLSRTFTIHRTAAQDNRGYLFNSSLPLRPASQTLRHQPGDYCRELTSAHNQQPDSNREPQVSKRKSLTTKLRALTSIFDYLPKNTTAKVVNLL